MTELAGGAPRGTPIVAFAVALLVLPVARLLVADDPPSAPPARHCGWGRPVTVRPAPVVAPQRVQLQLITPRDAPEMQRTLDQNRGGVEACYQRALLRDPTLGSGTFVVPTTIGMSGRVVAVDTRAARRFGSFDRCLMAVMSRWVFPGGDERYLVKLSIDLRAD